MTAKLIAPGLLLLGLVLGGAGSAQAACAETDLPCLERAFMRYDRALVGANRAFFDAVSKIIAKYQVPADEIDGYVLDEERVAAAALRAVTQYHSRATRAGARLFSQTGFATDVEALTLALVVTLGEQAEAAYVSASIDYLILPVP